MRYAWAVGQPSSYARRTYRAWRRPLRRKTSDRSSSGVAGRRRNVQALDCRGGDAYGRAHRRHTTGGHRHYTLL